MIASHPFVHKYILFGHIYYIFFSHSSVGDVGHFLGIVTGNAHECGSKDVSLVNRFISFSYVYILGLLDM